MKISPKRKRPQPTVPPFDVARAAEVRREECPPSSGNIICRDVENFRSGLFARSRLERAWPNRQNERCPAASRRLGLSSRYKVKDANCQALAYVYARETRAGADIANVLTMDEARGVASNIAKLPSYSLARIRRLSKRRILTPSW